MPACKKCGKNCAENGSVARGVDGESPDKNAKPQSGKTELDLYISVKI